MINEKSEKDQFLDKLKKKPPAESLKMYQWLIMEDTQEKTPYLEFGWGGFILGIIHRW